VLLETDPSSGFMRYSPVPVTRAETGPLAGLTMGIKDLFDVAGYPTGCGNPAKLAEAATAGRTAPCVQALLDAGGVFVGKTITDELAFSLQGQNAHYGTPVNGAAPDRIPGGSSSGSAAAVSCGLVDFALGSDTGGSVRAPASYCGLYGIRTTQGRIDLAHCMPLAPGYDTAGWFARDADIFARVGDVLLGEDTERLPDGPPALLTDVLDLMIDAPTRDAMGPAIAQAERVLGPADRLEIGDFAATPNGLEDWLQVFRVTQALEIWGEHGAWIEARDPQFGPGVRDRFEWARRVSRDEAAKASALDLRPQIRAHVRGLAERRVLILPTVPAIAPLCATPVSELEVFRNRVLTMTCIGGISGLPQVSMPLVRHEGCPLGLSIIGPAGSDRALIGLARRIAAAG